MKKHEKEILAGCDIITTIQDSDPEAWGKVHAFLEYFSLLSYKSGFKDGYKDGLNEGNNS